MIGIFINILILNSNAKTLNHSLTHCDDNQILYTLSLSLSFAQYHFVFLFAEEKNERVKKLSSEKKFITKQNSELTCFQYACNSFERRVPLTVDFFSSGSLYFWSLPTFKTFQVDLYRAVQWILSIYTIKKDYINIFLKRR